MDERLEESNEIKNDGILDEDDAEVKIVNGPNIAILTVNSRARAPHFKIKFG
jgi:hypothetical protein